MSNDRFQFITKLPTNHKLFWDLAVNLDTPNKLAIADESGDYPDQTDDGVLHVDLTRPIVWHRTSSGIMQYISLPLIVEKDGRLSSTPIDMPTALIMAADHAMTIDLGNDQRFHVKREAWRTIGAEEGSPK